MGIPDSKVAKGLDSRAHNPGWQVHGLRGDPWQELDDGFDAGEMTCVSKGLQSLHHLLLTVLQEGIIGHVQQWLFEENVRGEDQRMF